MFSERLLWMAVSALCATAVINALPGFGGTGQIRKLAETPPILLVQGLLSADECNEMIHTARHSPQFESSSKATAAGNPGAIQWQQAMASAKGKTAFFVHFDVDKDGLLQDHEVSAFLAQGWNMPNHNHSALCRAIDKAASQAEGGKRRRRRVHSDVTQNVARPLTQHEFTNFDWIGYDRKLRKKQPHVFARYSNQARLPHQLPAVTQLQQRLAQVAGLATDVFMQSEEMLVVSYPERGHYSCHSDNSEEVGAYPHRYLTALVFLNDEFEGGELVFPYADSVAEPASWQTLKTECLPTKHCLRNQSVHPESGSLIIQPKRGDALIWDNVAVGKGAPSQLLPHGLHAGCEVRAGTKWIAIQWAWSEAIMRSGRSPRTTQMRKDSHGLAEC